MNLSKTKRAVVLIILSMIAGLVYLAPFLRFSFYDQMQEALQLTDIQIGTIGSAYGIAYVAAFLPSGFLAKMFSTKKLLIVSCLGMALSTFWYSCYPGFLAYVIIHVLYGIFSVGTFWSPYLTAVRSLGTEEEQGKIFGTSEALRGVAQTIVSSICLGALGVAATLAFGFKMVLYINAAAFLILMFAVLFFVPDFSNDAKEEAGGEMGEGSSEEKKENIIVSALHMLKKPSIWICIMVIMCGYTIWATVNSYIGTYCTRVLQIPTNISSVISIIRSYIIVLIAGVSGGVIMDRFRTKGQGMIIAYFLCGVSAVLVLITGNIIFVCLGVTVILSYMVNVVKSTYWSIMGDAGITLAETSLATAIISLIGLTGDIFVPPVISRFLAYGEAAGNIELGFRMMFIWIIVWSAIGMFFSLLLKKKKESLSAEAN